MAPVVLFGASLKESGNPLAGGKIFSILLLLRLLTQPLADLFQAIPMLAATIGCLNRIQTYLRSEERVDRRSHSARPGSTISSFVDMSFPSESRAETIHQQPQDEINLAYMSSIPDKKVTVPGNRSLRAVKTSFGWDTGLEGKPVVKEVNLDLEFSQLTIIVGPAGSGKSTLLKGLLGETPYFEGDVDIYEKHVAFCDQTAWLTNGTIQENILGTSIWSQAWYKTVVHACALDEDFTNIPGGDQSNLGSNGINLSGGQKQRVAVARAVYSRCKIIVLDDVLSGLDRKTDKLLFDRLLSSEGLLRREGICVVMATHAGSYSFDGPIIPSANRTSPSSPPIRLDCCAQRKWGS